ncbi:hypothetical protein D3C86_2245580 [compost metagenome]
MKYSIVAYSVKNFFQVMAEPEKISPDNMEQEVKCKVKNLWYVVPGMHLKQVLMMKTNSYLEV